MLTLTKKFTSFLLSKSPKIGMSGWWWILPRSSHSSLPILQSVHGETSISLRNGQLEISLRYAGTQNLQRNTLTLSARLTPTSLSKLVSWIQTTESPSTSYADNSSPPSNPTSPVSESTLIAASPTISNTGKPECGTS